MGKEVEAMFDDIADDYDRANRVLSFGVDRSWRRRTVGRSGVGRGDRVLDLATGTGELALRFQKAVGPMGRVVALDVSQGMLAASRRKFADAPNGPGLLRADAHRLPFRNGCFDVASIGFGIRNVDDPTRALAEMARVVRPGGRVVVLEFGQPVAPMRGPYRWYSRRVIPRLGEKVTGNREAYEYLPQSVAEFPSGGDFVALMEAAADFEDVRARRLTGGVAWTYVGVVGGP